MTVESRILMYASWKDLFKNVAAHAEREAAKAKVAQQNDKFKVHAKKC